MCILPDKINIKTLSTAKDKVLLSVLSRLARMSLIFASNFSIAFGPAVLA